MPSSRRRPKTYVIDIRHYLDEQGRLASMPSQALDFALHCGAIVAWVTSHRSARQVLTNVYCRARVDRARCATPLLADVDADGVIRWGCPHCGKQGYVSGWPGTEWDRSPRATPGPAPVM